MGALGIIESRQMDVGQLISLLHIAAPPLKCGAVVFGQKGPGGMNQISNLLERLASGDEAERERILEALQEQARSSGNVGDLHNLAMAYVQVRSFLPAAEIWEQLLENLGPQADAMRMSLGQVYDALGFTTLSRYHFAYLTQHGSTQELRQFGEDQLRQLAEEERERRARQAQFASALRRAENAGDLVDLEVVGAFIPEMIERLPLLTDIKHIHDLLEGAARKYPSSVLVLLGLCYCKGALGDTAGSQEMMLKAQRAISSGAQVALPIDPATFAASISPGVPWRATAHLVRLAQSDANIADSAIADLRKFVEEHPRDTNCAFALGFALLSLDRFDDLRYLAGRLPALEQATHNYHYNAGQLFMAAGDIKRGERSLRLALKLAKDHAEAADAREKLREFDIENE
jgi:tetratricopeptide (TPR) repeat protein